MRRTFALAAILGCTSGGSPMVDSGEPLCDGGCGIGVAAYCATASCPTVDPSNNPGVLCSYCGGHCVTVYGGLGPDDAGGAPTCGYTLVFVTGDGGSQEQVWDTSGNLLALYALGPGTSCCVAGPPSFSVPSLQGCLLLSQPTCDSGSD